MHGRPQSLIAKSSMFMWRLLLQLALVSTTLCIPGAAIEDPIQSKHEVSMEELLSEPSMQACPMVNNMEDPQGQLLIQGITSISMEQDGVLVGADVWPRKGRVQAVQHRVNVTPEILCRRTLNAGNIDPDASCPKACPYWAEVVGELSCRFQCVAKEQCGTLDPTATIADSKSWQCRRCSMIGCKECVNEWNVEKCAKCNPEFDLVNDDCVSKYRYVWYSVYTILGVIGVFLVGWYINLRCRPITNEEAIEHGLHHRKRTRLHQPRAEGSNERWLWPLSTNLLGTQVAGPGLSLFMRFQLVIIVWSAVMAGGWLILSGTVSTDLLVLGSKFVNTPQQMCSVTAWGYSTTKEYIYVKFKFIVGAYIATFVGSILFAISQMREFEELDDAGTMKDFAALCTGLPTIQGSWHDAEAQIAERIQEVTKQEVIGVSICWSFKDREKEIMAILEEDILRLARSRPSYVPSTLLRLSIRKSTRGQPRTDQARAARSPRIPENPPTRVGMLAQRIWPGSIFSLLDSAMGFKDEAQTDEDLKSPRETLNAKPRPGQTMEAAFVESLESTGQAFVVFASEDSRDAAVAAIEPLENREPGCLTPRSFANNSVGGFKLSPNDKTTAHLQAISCEPDTVNWENFSVSKTQAMLRLIFGIFCIIIAMAAWTCLFYLPYAFWVTSQYSRGEKPRMQESFIFSMLVVCGNQLMYFLCMQAAFFAKFRFTNTTEMVYMALYFMSVLVNLCLDMAVTSYLSYQTMEHMGARSDHGQLLSDLSFVGIFQSYAMQKQLGNFVMWYAFPSCFLIPFIIEPIFTFILPMHLMELLVRANRNIQGFDAEKCLGWSSPMDPGRYADVLLNATIAAFAFLFPGSYVLKLFLLLCGSHIYIILYDHYRVLRAVPGFKMATDKVDRCAMMMTAIPTGVLAATVAFKYMSLPSVKGEEADFTDADYLKYILGSFFLHVAVHWSLLSWFVPLFSRSHEITKLPYENVAKENPSSWFSANPVHCLRSKYIKGDDPPCAYFFLGKEYLLQSNPKIGIHFEDPVKCIYK